MIFTNNYHLTWVYVCVLSRILSLAYSPSGTSFVCSAAAHSARTGSVSEAVPRVALPVSGRLLLWDTKTVKQQVHEDGCLGGFACKPSPSCGDSLMFSA